MFFKYFDFLSPPLTLYFFGQHSHSHIIGGLLTIITYFLSLSSLFYFSLDLIYRKNPTAYFYNINIEDAGNYIMNSPSMFHYIKINNVKSNLNFLQVIGFENLELSEYSNNGIRENYSHYIYNYCTEEMLKNISKDIINLLNKTHFLEDSFCIESYYNSKTKIITKYNEKNFSYPVLRHGASHPNRTFYGIFFQKCINSTINNNSCDSLENINKKIYGISFDLRLLNFNVDIKNYKKPLIYSFISITTGYAPNNFAANHLNFQPLKIKSHNGLIFDSLKEEKQYKFEVNEKQIWESNFGIIGTFYFWMQHNLILYERNYKRIQNILADFGGITKAINLFSSFLNWAFSNFILIKDVKKLLFSLINLKNLNYNLYNFNFSFDDINNSSSFISFNNSFFKSKNVSLLKNHKHYNNNNFHENFKIDNSQISKLGISVFSDNYKLEKYSSNNKKVKKKIKKNDINNIFNKKIKTDTNPEIVFKKKINFCNYILWILCCRTNKFKKTRNIGIINDTYRKFISEETLFFCILFIKKYEKKFFDFQT